MRPSIITLVSKSLLLLYKRSVKRALQSLILLLLWLDRLAIRDHVKIAKNIVMLAQRQLRAHESEHEAQNDRDKRSDYRQTRERTPSRFASTKPTPMPKTVTKYRRGIFDREAAKISA